MACKRNAAAGVDGQTWAGYGQNLESNLLDLSDRLGRGGYHPQPAPPPQELPPQPCSPASSVLRHDPTSHPHGSSSYAYWLHDARCANTLPSERSRRWDLPVPVQSMSMRAWGLRPRGAQTHLAIAMRPVLPSMWRHHLGTPEYPNARAPGGYFAAQYPAHTFPCQRFACVLTGAYA